MCRQIYLGSGGSGTSDCIAAPFMQLNSKILTATGSRNVTNKSWHSKMPYAQ